MTRRIEHIVTLDPDDFEALHTIYTNKGNADPIVNAYRRTLRATTPTWLHTPNSPLTRNRLKELITTLDDSDNQNNSTHRTRRITRNAHRHAHPPRPNHHPAEMTPYSPSASRAIRRKYSRE